MAGPSLNQFSQSTVQGQMDLEFQGSVISAQVSVNQATALVAGQAVKIENSAGGVPKMLATTANTDPVFGFVARNLKDQNFPTYARLEAAMKGRVMYMTASAANPSIARGAPVEYDYATQTVLQSLGINTVVGFALDQAVNAGDLIRVFIDLQSGNVSRSVKTATVVATLAQINAGLVAIPAKAGAQITVLDTTERVLGTFASGTSVELESSATAVAVETIAEAALTNGAVLKPTSANVTLGPGFAAPLPVGEGLSIVNNGAAQTGGTSITFTITYQQF